MDVNIVSDISLIIVTWNGDDMLKTALDSIVKIYGMLPETVVVDNANADSTESLVGEYENAQYIPLKENRGFAGGNNAALPFCTKKYIIFLNNDTELTGDAFSPLINFLDAHPNAAAAQGKVVLASNGLLDGCGGFFSPLGILAFRGAFEKDQGQYETPCKVFTIGGAFFALRRSAIADAGGLFYDHFKSYYEEIDLCLRINLAGMECWYVPTPKVLHRHSATMNKFNYADIKRQYYRNIWFSILTCYGPIARHYFGSILLLLSLVQSLGGLVKGQNENLKAHCFAISETIKNRPDIIATRHRLRKYRKINDSTLFRFAIRSQPWSFYNLLKRI